ncbi:MAG: 3-phosphoshikimate 1-carboxyvinyltransferase [Gammaproteobacteria bacterium]|nr:3-phosphoshikimate 1-carboxyvinyltransferase [Gammaproteobacteria bacterium]
MSARRIINSQFKSTEITVPGSKYLANRYIALAAISPGKTVLTNVPQNDDIAAALEAVKALGAKLDVTDSTVEIEGIRDYKSEQLININCRDSGTLSRFITAVAAALESSVTVDASEQMRNRPMQEIIASLQQLGVKVSSKNGHLPIQLQGPIIGGQCDLNASRSSQFLSGLLIAALKAKSDTLIQLENDPVSESYINLTIRAIEKFSGEVKRINNRDFLVTANQKLKSPTIEVASDAVSYSYFMAAALIAESNIKIKHYDFDSVQGESRFPELLELMGAKVSREANDLLIAYAKPLQAITVDMGNMPDVVPTMAVLAAFAQGTTHITNIAHLAYKESNRIVDLCQQLIKIGVPCEYGGDYIKITGGAALMTAEVSSCHDHRLAMSLALLGIQLPGLVVKDAQAVEKSFPDYWQYLEQIGIVSEELE